jgi:hypothetical protein
LLADANNLSRLWAFFRCAGDGEASGDEARRELVCLKVAGSRYCFGSPGKQIGARHYLPYAYTDLNTNPYANAEQKRSGKRPSFI